MTEDQLHEFVGRAHAAQEAVDQLIEASSLGTPGAQGLRARTSPEDVAEVKRQAFDPCPRCGHDFNLHPMAALFEDAMDGGVIVCQEAGCMCVATWSAQGRPRPEMPPTHVLDQVRAQVQE